MKIGIISEERDWITDELKNKLEQNDIDPIIIKPSKIVNTLSKKGIKFEHNSRNLFDLECAFVRNIGFGDEMMHRFDMIENLSHFIPIINPPQSIQDSGNKYRTSFLLAKNEIPQAETIISEDINKILAYSDKFDDSVLKPFFGNGGQGLVRLKGRSTVTKLNTLNTFKESNPAFYMQRFVNNPNNVYRDIRAFVIGDRVVSAMYRESDNWITNIKQNGTPKQCEVTREISKLALAAKEALGLYYAGVDLIESETGLKVIEVNACPSWEGLSKVSEEDITQLLVNEVSRIVKKHKMDKLTEKYVR
ncbi:tetrahydromethanopterin:alpha-L-glutamate ligase [Methanococcus voltae]|uniref:tetrahydromethanopterin:alpha-L-glutamate ligase n=1 Tax=Methanococcus voltae TaxID=2188 RepID=UPI001AE45250|nr:tetrahydromethanopterin:alpha-L-glutamate ligase [Methanococcus voltae]MBP2143431.1 tetrahydromethanopterin:alpha-L-glutamate ligase [Methanococcus voltae]